MTAKCSNCLYAEAEGDKLLCKRYPPAGVTIQRRLGIAPVAYDWPQVRPSDKCGEYELDVTGIL